jgi:pimeloyl-ACP methyl ester carboxylesterase
MPWRETEQEIARARAERPVKVPAPDGDLFGIHTPADPDAPPAGICVIHLTRPRAHRNRNWVQAARHLATHGFSAFRFDYHGTGDSGGASAFLDPNAPYRADVVAVIRFLRERLGERRFILTGSCFDARTALSAFADEGDVIDGLVFIAAPVMSLEHTRELRDSSKDWRHLLRALNNPENWAALSRPERWHEMARVVTRVARRPRRSAGAPPGEGAGVPKPADPPLDPGFERDLEHLTRSRAGALFLYGEEDPEFRTFQPVLRDRWPTLPPGARERFEVEVWPGEVHGGFLDMQRQRLILQRTLEWIEARHPAATGSRAATTRPAEGAWTSA